MTSQIKAPKNKLKKSLPSLFIVVTLLFGFLLQVATFSANIDWPDNINQLEKYIYQHRYFTDFFQYGALIIVLLCANRFFKVFGYLLALLISLIYFIQSQSYATTGRYLPSIALENSDHINFLELDKIIISGLIWLVIFFAIFILINPWVKKASFKSVLLIAIAMIFISILIKNDKYFLAPEIVKSRTTFYNSGRPGIEIKSPIRELTETLDEYYSYLKKQHFLQKNVGVLSPRTAEFAYQKLEGFSQLNPDFPLIRNMIFDQEMDFIKQLNADKKKSKMNIIVFFIEGMSATLVEPYHDYFPGLTPNINDFSKKAIRVNNYYNHTYATYRGLAGQVCSSFPIGRLLEEVNYNCLAHVLSDEGYKSRFMVSQRLNKTDLDSVLKKAGFDEIDGYRSIAKLLSPKRTTDAPHLPDRQLIDGLIVRLKNIEKNPNTQPHLIGLYNFETHTGIYLNEDDTVYRGTKNNPQEQHALLDTFHNFDKQFGQFWSYFKNSSLYDNTVVVVTSDHATFPSRAYNTALKGQLSKHLFLDTIPLLVYHPDLTHSVEIDAEQSNSLDLAPSLLHLLGINNIKTTFLGRSLFTNKESVYAKMGGSSSKLWFRSKKGYWRQITEKNKEDMRSYDYETEALKLELLHYIENLERSNKLWSERKQ